MPNPNPPTEQLKPTQWKPGETGNPGGLSSEMRRMIAENAEKATRIRQHLLDHEIALIEDPIEGGLASQVREALKDIVSDKRLDQVIMALEASLTPERLKLIKDSEDRGLGAPTSKTAFTDPDGNAIGGKFTLEFIEPSGARQSEADI